MRCARCNCVMEPDEETWVQGQPLCEDCSKQNMMQWWKGGGLVALIVLCAILIVFVLPLIFFCVCSGMIAGNAGK